MRSIDWILIAATLGTVLAFALYTRRYTRSVADFLAAGRCAGRYLLANARGEADAGVANTLARFEIVLVSGFVLNFWEKISLPIILLVAASGFVFYRFRETRALTLAQFFEMRYSRNFRLFMGLLAFVSGILNYGIFPAVGSRFFAHFLDLPRAVHVGAFVIPTFTLIMFAYLALTVITILIGGQVTLMITDCIEGLMSHVIYLALIAAAFCVVSWRQVVDVMSHLPARHSLINPLDAQDVQDFNLAYVLMALLINIYTTMALQNRQGFNAAARTPHESRMGAFLGQWRMHVRFLMLLVLGACALAYIKHPDFALQSAPIQNSIASISDPYIQKQMTIPIALRYMLPAGIKGLFCAMMIMGLLAGDAGHLHSWGSILIQDVFLPLRGERSLSQRQHLWVLRISVIAVASFAFLFSTLFTQSQYIRLWWDITAGIFTGGAGAAIIGGLYWKKGTTPAAWAAALVGCSISFLGIYFTSKLNYMQFAFIAACSAALVYIVVSYLTCRANFDLNRLLHRADTQRTSRQGVRNLLSRLLGFDSEFTFRDKLVAAGVVGFTFFLLLLNITVLFWNWLHEWPIAWWATYWLTIGIVLPLIISVVTLIWFGFGAIVDIRKFFRALAALKRDATDDGRVLIPGNVTQQELKQPERVAPRAFSD